MRSDTNVPSIQQLAAEIRGYGYTLALDEQGRLKVSGSERPPHDLTRRITGSRDALAALVLLERPPAWLMEVLRRYRTGETVTGKRAGQQVTLRVDSRCLAANVATGMGRDPTAGPALQPAVEDVLAGFGISRESAM